MSLVPSPRNLVPGSASGVRTWPGEALTVSLPHLLCHWFLHHQWLLLDLD
ncbi:hypothetical protein LEMLEM_LOCUS4569 [Lemmus lemmus]